MQQLARNYFLEEMRNRLNDDDGEKVFVVGSESLSRINDFDVDVGSKTPLPKRLNEPRLCVDYLHLDLSVTDFSKSDMLTHVLLMGSPTVLMPQVRTKDYSCCGCSCCCCCCGGGGGGGRWND